MGNRDGPRFHNQNYRWLFKTQGELCLICCRPPPPSKKLEIDHITYDERMWEPENISLMCPSCNLSLRHKTEEEHRFIVAFYRALNVRERDCVNEKDLSSFPSQPPAPKKNIMEIINFMHGPTEMQAKSLYEPLFAVFSWELVSQYGSYPEKDMLDSFFHDTRCSQVTSRRYLDGYCSAKGTLKREKDSDGNIIITFKYPVRSPSRRRKKLK